MKTQYIIVHTPLSVSDSSATLPFGAVITMTKLQDYINEGYEVVNNFPSGKNSAYLTFLLKRDYKLFLGN